MASVEQWAEMVGTLAEPRSGERERDVATWRVCLELCSNRDGLKPIQFVNPIPWSNEDAAAISSLRRASPEELGRAASVMPQEFGRWRCHVTEHEALQAQRLQSLGWALQQLYRLRDRPSAKVEPIDKVVTVIGDVLMLDWRAGDVPLQGDYREWASRTTRRYDLLPKHWRWV